MCEKCPFIPSLPPTPGRAAWAELPAYLGTLQPHMELHVLIHHSHALLGRSSGQWNTCALLFELYEPCCSL